MAIYIAQASVQKWPLAALRQAKYKQQRTGKIHKSRRKQLHTTKQLLKSINYKWDTLFAIFYHEWCFGRKIDYICQFPRWAFPLTKYHKHLCCDPAESVGSREHWLWDIAWKRNGFLVFYCFVNPSVTHNF